MILGIILNGGSSQRFGRNKALAKAGDLSLLDTAKKTLMAATDIQKTVGRDCDIPDDVKWGEGPAAGLATALDWAQNESFDAVLVIPVDMPLLESQSLKKLPPNHYAVDAIDKHPTIAHYSIERWRKRKSELAKLKKPISLRKMTDVLGALPFPIPKAQLINVNTPKQLEEALSNAKH